MDIVSYMSLIILAITLMTLVFGVIAYCLYKVREKRNRKRRTLSYEEKRNELGTDFIFFER